MQLWFYKAKYGDWWDRVISVWTWETYSHVELVFSDGQCFSSSSRDGGARFKKIPLSEKWTVVDIGHANKEAKIEQWCKAQIGKRYDWWGAVACGLNLQSPRSSEDKWFCAEIICYVLNRFGICHVRTTMTPDELYEKFCHCYGHCCADLANDRKSTKDRPNFYEK